MSDPRFDVRNPPPPRYEAESTNGMWGWIAGAVVLALVLFFVFTRGQVSDTNTASNVPNPPAATTMAPSRPAPLKPPAPTPVPPASTTGQGNSQ